MGLISVALVHAADPPVAPDGYKMVAVQADGKTGYIAVKKETDPYQNVKGASTDDKYDPSQADFRAESRWAHKTFGTSDAATSHTGAAAFAQRHFITQAFATKAAVTVPNLDKRVMEPAAAGYGQRAAEASKGFAGARASDYQQKSATTAVHDTSDFQGRTAVLGGGKTPTFASNFNGKSFQDPELADVRHEGADRMNSEALTMKDLPNRPLTIDEVRALINHGVRPNLEAPPEAPTKALNDPDYKPEAEPAQPEPEKPSVAHRADNESDDPLPSPGTMALDPAPPENAQPLPK